MKLLKKFAPVLMAAIVLISTSIPVLADTAPPPPSSYTRITNDGKHILHMTVSVEDTIRYWEWTDSKIYVEQSKKQLPSGLYTNTNPPQLVYALPEDFYIPSYALGMSNDGRTLVVVNDFPGKSWTVWVSYYQDGVLTKQYGPEFFYPDGFASTIGENGEVTPIITITVSHYIWAVNAQFSSVTGLLYIKTKANLYYLFDKEGTLIYRSAQQPVPEMANLMDKEAELCSKLEQSETADVTVENISYIDLDTIKEIERETGPFEVGVDQMDALNHNVMCRMTFRSDQMSKDIVPTSAYQSSLGYEYFPIKNYSEKFPDWPKIDPDNFYSYGRALIRLDQKEDFGMPVEIAIDIDISQLPRKALYFYSYDRDTKTLRAIENPNAWIDEKGYLHFTTELAGEIYILGCA